MNESSRGEELLILGASARAAAQSARRAGYQPTGVDLFADVDLADVGTAIKVVNYPSGLAAAVESLPATHWMYTGALENHPELVDRVSRRHRLLGNSAAILRRVRDLKEVNRVLTSARIATLSVRSTSPAEYDGSWMRKPLRSSGGMHVARFRSNEATDQPASSDFIYQKFVEGDAISAVFAAASGQAELLGCTRQLIGTAWLGSHDFRYAGSLGPLPLPSSAIQQFRAIGECLSREFDLCGLFGVDAIWDGDTVWALEVNPRYTASVEILEHQLGISAVTLHVEACRGRLPDLPTTISARTAFGKAILFAKQDIEMSVDLFAQLLDANANRAWPSFADLPNIGAQIQGGQPILTVFADGDSLADVEDRLRCIAGDLYAAAEFRAVGDSPPGTR